LDSNTKLLNKIEGINVSKEEKVSMRILMHALNFGMQEIAKFDNNFKSKLAGKSVSMVWKIGDDISFVTEIADGEIKGYEGAGPDNPTLKIEIEDAGKGLSMLMQGAEGGGSLDMGTMMKDVKVSGDAAKVPELSFMLEGIANYLGGLME